MPKIHTENISEVELVLRRGRYSVVDGRREVYRGSDEKAALRYAKQCGLRIFYEFRPSDATWRAVSVNGEPF